MIDLEKQNQIFETASPEEILKWGWARFNPEIALLSSFGTESVVLLHMISEHAPAMKVLFLETGFHFPETSAYKKLLIERFRLRVEELTAAMPRAEFVRDYGENLYDRDPDKCCGINKVEPLERVLRGLRAWVTGIRRGQGPTRKNIHILERYEGGLPDAAGGRPLYKLNPLANWSSREAWHYIKTHQLPVHPLFEKGYTSIGCWPCTRPVLSGEEERAGRWAGRVKTECGIHTFLKPKEPPK
jgi:phosphoadenosine phosphosulfate reductase